MFPVGHFIRSISNLEIVIPAKYEMKVSSFQQMTLNSLFSDHLSRRPSHAPPGVWRHYL